MEDISFEVEETTKVFCRTTGTEKHLPSRSIAQAVRLGHIDLVGPGSLPRREALRAGGRTLGDGHGYAWVRSKFSPDRATRMTLLAAQHVVRNGMADYVGDGSEPIEAKPQPPALKRHAVAR